MATRTWKREGYTVEEREFDYSLHCFAVVIEGKDDFEEMIRDWKADHAEEMSDLEIDEITLKDGNWVAAAHDSKTAYTLSDDGKGNIVINYIGTR